MPTRTQQQSGPGALGRGARIHPEVVAVVLSMMVAVFVVGLATQRPARIERLGVRNLTDERLTISSGSPGDWGRTPVIYVWPERVRFATEIVDEGAIWVLLIESNSGRPSVEVEVTRRELVDADWVYTISESTLDALGRELGHGAESPPVG